MEEFEVPIPNQLNPSEKNRICVQNLGVSKSFCRMINVMSKQFLEY